MKLEVRNRGLSGNLLQLIVFGFVLAVAAGCASATQIMGTWKNPDIKPSRYDKVLVAALTGLPETKKLIEDELAIRLAEQGITVVKGTEVLTPDLTEDQLLGDQQVKEKFTEKIREYGANAILTVAVVDEEAENRLVPGNINYDPTVRFNFYGDFWGYYKHYVPVVGEQGYYEQDKTYFMETNLYDTQSEKLVWSSQSQSYNPEDEEAFSGEFAEVMVKEMEKEDVIK